MIPPPPLQQSSQPEPRRREIVMTRMQAWELMDRAQHKVDRLRAHYDAALAKGDLPLADALATDLFEADVAYRKTENRYARFIGKIPYGRHTPAKTTNSRWALFFLIMMIFPCTFLRCMCGV